MGLLQDLLNDRHMQGMNPGSNGQGGNGKSSGLSWSSPAPTQSTQPTLLGANTTTNVVKPAPVVAPKPTPTAKPAGATRTNTAAQKSSSRTAMMFAAGALLGIFLIVGWKTLNTPDTTTKTTTTNTSVASTNTGTPGASNVAAASASNTPAPKLNQFSTVETEDIVVPPQDAGTEVLVSDVTVSEPTWLVVYELYGGKPNRVLGAAMFFPEFNGKGGSISLARATQPHTTYFIGQTLDNAGAHTYTLHVNKEVLDTDGRMVGATFTTN